MSGTITLPRSGVPAEIWLLATDPDLADVWTCRVPNFESFEAYTRDAAIEVADRRVLALRAALLPPDARERVIAVLQSIPPAGDEGWTDEDLADAALRALGIGSP